MATKQLDLKALLEKKMAPDPGAQTAIEKAETGVPANLMFSATSSELAEPVTATATRQGLTVEEALIFDAEMTRFVNTVLTAGVDFGVIPRTSKPTLLKAGAEKVINFLGLTARAEIINSVEEHTENGYFAYCVKISLIDRCGVVRAEGLGCCNTRENRYAKSSGYANQNVALKMSKKRALVDAVLNVAALSSHFTQDVEDLPPMEPDQGGKGPERPSQQPNADRPASRKQISYIEQLMVATGTNVINLNSYVQKVYGVADFHQVSALAASDLIGKLRAKEGVAK